jgi:hypothetical protein
VAVAVAVAGATLQELERLLVDVAGTTSLVTCSLVSVWCGCCGSGIWDGRRRAVGNELVAIWYLVTPPPPPSPRSLAPRSPCLASAPSARVHEGVPVPASR